MAYKKVKVENANDKAVKKFRKIIGLPPLIKMYINCLRCEKEFFTEDKARNRLCTDCAKHSEVMVGTIV